MMDFQMCCMTTLLVIEMKKLGKSEKSSYAMTGKNETDKSENNTIITIAREYGSGGRYVAKMVAEKLGIKFYDKDLIEIVSNESGLSATYIEENEENIHGNLLSRTSGNAVNLYWVISPSLQHSNFDESRFSNGYFAILSSGRG